MKLAAIYNVFDGVELLKGSMNCLKDHVDHFILVVQSVSNYGEPFDGFEKLDFSEFQTSEKLVVIVRYEPELHARNAGMENETRKRNIGIDMARELECTHFMHVDCDEYYKNFEMMKQEFISSGCDGSVCQMMTYFARPTFRLELPDNYFVPFIHELKPHTYSGFVPYKYYVDPTRRIHGVEKIHHMSHMMHHFSYVRNDISLKIRNSSARDNILKSNLLEQYWSKELHENPEGFFIDGFHQKITVVENLFGINI